MPPIVVDANIIFAAIHSGASQTRQRLLTLERRLYTPTYLVVELYKHRQRLAKQAKATESEQVEYLEKVLHRVRFFAEDLIETGHFFEAYRLCKDVDLNDLPYVALALQLDADLWTRDEQLKIGLRARGFTRFFDEIPV